MRLCRQFNADCMSVESVRAEELRLLSALQWKLHGPTAFELGIELQLLLRHHVLGTPRTAVLAAARCVACGCGCDEAVAATGSSTLPVLLSVESFVAVLLDLALLDEHHLRFPATAVALSAMKVRRRPGSTRARRGAGDF